MEKQIMRGKVPVIICAAISLLGFLACISVIFFTSGFGSAQNAQSGFGVIWFYLRYIVFPVLPCLIFSLYIFFFRETKAGVFLLPAAFVLAAIQKAIAAVVVFQQIPFYTNNGLGSITSGSVFLIARYILFIAACGVIAAAAIKGFPSRLLLIPASAVLLFCHTNLLFNYIYQHTMYSIPLEPADIITYVSLFAVFIGTLVYGLANITPSFSEVFRGINKKQVIKKNLRERKELEEELDELKFRRDNGFLPQEDYAELAAEITERLNELNR